MTAPYYQDEHLGHPDGGTWCGATNDPGVADVRPRVPVCAACHIKAMHARTAIVEAAREWAKADREVVAAIGQGGPNHWRRWADLNAREKAARLALRAVVDAEMKTNPERTHHE